MSLTFLTEAECLPNLNRVDVAGQVTQVTPYTKQTVGISFVVTYQKHWPTGEVGETPINCYISGAERIKGLAWLTPGVYALVSGELTAQGRVYAMSVTNLSEPTPTPPSRPQRHSEGRGR